METQKVHQRSHRGRNLPNLIGVTVLLQWRYAPTLDCFTFNETGRKKFQYRQRTRKSRPNLGCHHWINQFCPIKVVSLGRRKRRNHRYLERMYGFTTSEIYIISPVFQQDALCSTSHHPFTPPNPNLLSQLDPIKGFHRSSKRTWLP